MMEDRELLELAAKAVGMGVHPSVKHHDHDTYCKPPAGPQQWWVDVIIWNPLTDDGDALRLANQLGICIHFTSCADDAPIVGCGYDIDQKDWPFYPNFPDQGKATRRAIVRAAAEIGKSLP